MLFKTVALVFEAIEHESSRLAMTQRLADLLKQATPAEAEIICTMSLGQLHPPYIATELNLSTKNTVKPVARLLDKSEQEVTNAVKKEGDLGLVVAHGQWGHDDELTVHDVYNSLCALEKITGTGSQEEKSNKVFELLHQLDPLSAKYVTRIIIGKLRLGFSDMTIVDALSWMAVGSKAVRGIIEDAFNVCADIGLIAKILKQDGLNTVEQMGIKVGIPIRPAGAERLPTARAIVEKIGHCVAQPKLDGFRLQIHVDKTQATPQVYFYSRHLKDMSFMFPDLTQAFEQLNVKELICEGEAIVYDANADVFLPFQETVKRKRKHDIEQVAAELPLQVFLFDLLYVDGQEYLSKTHAQRRTKLLTLFDSHKKDTIKVIQEQEITTAEQLENYFTSNIAAGLEGLVVKKEDSIYKAGKRNFNWIKLKRQEEGQLDDTIDAVILGYYAGAGKRAGFGIGAFLVGVYNTSLDCFETVAKVGTGLKDNDWIELKKRCDSVGTVNKPKNINCPKELYPDVWTSPEIVCLIRADEITMSPLHTAGKTAENLGFALRFPRFMGYVTDKKPNQATSVAEIKQLYKNQFGK